MSWEVVRTIVIKPQALFRAVTITLLSAVLLAGTVNLVFAANSSQPEIRKLSDERVKELVENPDYQYIKTPDFENPWEVFKQMFRDFIMRLFNNDGVPDVYDAIQIGLIIGVLVLLVYIGLRASSTGLFTGKKAMSYNDGAFSVVEEDIHSIDYNKLISDAVNRKDFKTALRLQFLRLLKGLADGEHIDWNQNKTNREYYNELKDQGLKSGFKTAYGLFEYIWYGKFELDQTDYTIASKEFDSMNQRIGNKN